MRIVPLGGLQSPTGDCGDDDGTLGQKDLPLVSHTFRADTHNTNKTELIVLITRFIVNDDYHAHSITSAFRGMLGPRASEQLKSRASPMSPASPAANTP